MGIVEHLALLFENYADAMCYGTGVLIFLVIYAIFRGGGMKKPKKDEIFPFVKKILKYFQDRKK